MTAPRLLAGRRTDGQAMTLAEHRALHGASPERARRGDAKALQVALTGTGVRGRGGAGFPAARKLAAAWDAGGKAMVVANAAEGEPASEKDRVLLQHAPHLVLDGLQLAARSVEAREAVLVLHKGSPARAVVERAVAERDDPLPVRLIEVPDRYVSGEASAVARAAGGGPSLPVLHDRPLAVRGLDRRPTVVLNVETLADVALLLHHGPAWYGQVGTPEEPGTVLLTVRASDHLPVVLEVALGTTLGTALIAAGIEALDLQAVLVGGYFGAWLRLPSVLDVPISHAGLRAAGGTLGAGLIMCQRHDECPLDATAGAARYLATQSAGQCGPCVNGLPALATALEELVAGYDTRDALARYAGLVTGRGLCHQPDGAAALVRSALTAFPDHVEEHLRRVCTRPAGTALAVPRVLT